VGSWLDHSLQSKWRIGAEMQLKVVERMYKQDNRRLGRLLEAHPEIPVITDGPPLGPFR
jgi:hypothetical protein